MFRIVCFVDDRKLPNVLHALANLVVNMEPPQPVMNAVAKNGKLEQVSSGSSKRSQLLDLLRKRSGQQTTTREMREMWAELGGTPASVNSELTTYLIENRAIKRLKGKGQFQIL